VQPIESDAERIARRQLTDRPGHLGLHLRQLARDRDARIQRERQHERDEPDPGDERVGRRPDEFHDEEAHEEDASAGVGDQVKLPQEGPEQRAGEHAALDGIGRLEDAERLWCDEQAENRHPAKPHHERQQREVPDGEHPVIIIARVEDQSLDWLIGEVLHTLARGARIAPPALILLLRRYGATGRADIGEALGPALAAALDGVHSLDRSIERSAWLSLFVEAAAISDDDRLPAAAAGLVARLRNEWPARGELEPAVRSVDACLGAASTLPDLFNPSGLVPAAVDELERVVHLAYRPGEGLPHTLVDPEGGRGTLGDHVATASTLLTAYAITGRLPYSMLAEELMQYARRTDPEAGGSDLERFLARADAARVLCRLAKLHEDADYRQAAVTADNAAYAEEAKRALAALASTCRAHGADAALYGLALGELQDLR